MIAFADLVARLAFALGDEAKRAWLQHYFESVPDPDRGWALAAIAGRLDVPVVGPGVLRALAARRCEPTLFGLSRDYVGDLGETLALMWPAEGGDDAPRLGEVVARLRRTPKAELPALIESWLDVSSPAVRAVLLKLVTGHLAMDADLVVARAALAEISQGRVGVGDIEAVWHTLAPPYGELFAWVDGRGGCPCPVGVRPYFAPMLAAAGDADAIAGASPDDDAAEWFWDGLRVQLVTGAAPRLLSRAGEEIGAGFPGVGAASAGEAVLDGMLLASRDGVALSATELVRLGRGKGRGANKVSVLIRLHDMLFDGGEDLRGKSLAVRRRRLEAWFARAQPPYADLSPLLSYRDRDDLLALCRDARTHGAQGVMLKRLDAPYIGARMPGLWRKYKTSPLHFSAVLMYVEAGRVGAGAITAGVWDGDRLVPLGRAENHLGQPEAALLNAWVAVHTRARFGPVREVDASLVLRVACDAVLRSARSRAGLALRRPRIVGLRQGIDAARADTLAEVARWVMPGTSPAMGGTATA